ncbi:unnamed protein product, partial [marine sediment metagenome]
MENLTYPSKAVKSPTSGKVNEMPQASTHSGHFQRHSAEANMENLTYPSKTV